MKIVLVEHHPLVQQALLRALDELRPEVRMVTVSECGPATDLPQTRDELGLVVMCRKDMLEARFSSPLASYGAVEWTERQAQVLALLVQGKPNKIISRELGLAQGTVKIHVTAIFRKLKVSNRTQAALAAGRLGFASATSARTVSPFRP